MRFHPEGASKMHDSRGHGNHKIQLRNNCRRVVIVIRLAGPAIVAHIQPGLFDLRQWVLILQADKIGVHALD